MKMDFPSWFGMLEFYMILVTMWGYFGMRVLIALIYTNGLKLNIKDTVSRFKTWWAKKTGKTYSSFEEYGFKEYVE